MSIILKRLRSRTRKFLGIGKRPKAHRNLKARFTYVYRGKTWKSEESVSGPGSTLESGSVRQAMSALSHVVRHHPIGSIADLPCGDFNWMPAFLQQHPEIKYAGYDIVDELVAQNRRTQADRTFRVLDVTTQIPPYADLLFSKDLVNHLLERDVWSALANMIRSGATYLMITSNADPMPNEELSENVAGASRPLNLQIAPYNFPPPLYDDGYLAMWRTKDLAFILTGNPDLNQSSP